MSIPNTTTFSLQDVVDEVNPTTDDLVDCFADANPLYFHPTYGGSKNSLLNFRDYGVHNVPTISVTPSNYTFNNGGSTYTWTVTVSSGDWTLGSIPSWLSTGNITPTSFQLTAGNGGLSGYPLTGIDITLDIDPSIKDTIYVAQDGR